MKSGGIFGKNYVLYLVKTAPVGWEVKRRFSDFEWFRGMVLRLYPHVYVRRYFTVGASDPTEEASGTFRAEIRGKT